MVDNLLPDHVELPHVLDLAVNPKVIIVSAPSPNSFFFSIIKDFVGFGLGIWTGAPKNTFSNSCFKFILSRVDRMALKIKHSNFNMQKLLNIEYRKRTIPYRAWLRPLKPSSLSSLS